MFVGEKSRVYFWQGCLVEISDDSSSTGFGGEIRG